MIGPKSCALGSSGLVIEGCVVVTRIFYAAGALYIDGEERRFTSSLMPDALQLRLTQLRRYSCALRAASPLAQRGVSSTQISVTLA